MVETKKTFQVVVNIVMILISLCCLLPFILLFMSSITEENTLVRYGYTFFPRQFSLEAYRYLLIDSSKILKGYGITILITAVGTSLNLLITTLMAYPLSRRDLPHRNKLAFIVFFTMLFNGGLVPSYLMWTQFFKIKDTIFALIFPNLLMNAFYVIMMRTYFSTNIPEAVIEAARIDGTSEPRILFQIALPMSLPMIATLGLLTGLGYWNDWINGLYYIVKRTDLYSIQNILNRMLLNVQFLTSGAAGSFSSELASTLPSVGIKMAVAILGILPIMVAYPFFQKYFVKGITIGAVKG